VHELVPEQLREQVGPPRLVVHVADQRVLDRQPPACLRGVVHRGAQHLADRPARVDRHEGVAQLVVRRVQGQREGDLQALLRQAAHRRDQADGGDDDAALADADAVRRRVDDPADGADHPVVVRQRLAHAHEDDVADPAAAGRLGALGGDDLLDDLAVDRLRVSPAWPVAQNGQAMPQPAWLLMQTVVRSG
jgi:hypothetical protein